VPSPPLWPIGLFVWVVADGWCCWWLVTGGWFVLREKYWLVADKPSEQGEGATRFWHDSWHDDKFSSHVNNYETIISSPGLYSAVSHSPSLPSPSALSPSSPLMIPPPYSPLPIPPPPLAPLPIPSRHCRGPISDCPLPI
jgi:hypothetical protein